MREAIDALARGTELDPSRPDIHLQLARALRTSGALAEADAELERAAAGRAGSRVDQLQIDLELATEQGLLKLAQDQLDAAIRLLQKALAMEPADGPANRALAQVYLRQGSVRAGRRARRPRGEGRRALERRGARALAAKGRPHALMPRRALVLALLLLAPVAMGAQTRSRAGASPALFTDVTARAGITFVHQSGASPEKRMPETFGSGVAWIDYDNDGYPDLYFVNGAAGSANALYHNNHDGTFTDVTARAGVAASADRTRYKTGVAVGDFDNDGFLDLYVTALGRNTLFRNNGDGTFTDVTASAGVAGDPLEWSTSAGFFDMDGDGDLDLYVVNYLSYDAGLDKFCGQRQPGYRTYCHPTLFDGQADRLFRNNGDGTFTDVSRAAGIANPAGKGLGVTFCDFDRDGDVDVYVANDTVRNFLYRNDGHGRFVDVAYGAGVGFDPNGKPQAGMGVDCADVDGNGFPDLVVTNFSEELNTLYMNEGNGMFEDSDRASRPELLVHPARLRREVLRLRQRRRRRLVHHERPCH